VTPLCARIAHFNQGDKHEGGPGENALLSWVVYTGVNRQRILARPYLVIGQRASFLMRWASNLGLAPKYHLPYMPFRHTQTSDPACHRRRSSQRPPWRRDRGLGHTSTEGPHAASSLYVSDGGSMELCGSFPRPQLASWRRQVFRKLCWRLTRTRIAASSGWNF